MRSARCFLPAIVVLLCACTSGQVAQLPPPATPNLATQSKLQLAVGTATIGVANGAAVAGLNIVTTFRVTGGNNATNLNTPTIKAPAGFNFGPLFGSSNTLAGFAPARYVALESALAAKQNPTAQEQQLTHSLGPYVGVFGYGLAADNLLAVNDTLIQADITNGTGPECVGIGFAGLAGFGLNSGGQAISTSNAFYGGTPSGVGNNGIQSFPPNALETLSRSAELALPLPSGNFVANGATTCYCPGTCGPNGTPLFDPAFPTQFFGGPPAWPSPQGYGNYSYFVGYPSGFTDFAATPVAGTYSLSVAYPTATDFSTSATVTASATLKSTRGLPVIMAPTIKSLGDGSAVISLTVPPGLFETIVYVVAQDCDLGGRYITNANYFNHYALVTKNSGPQQLFLASKLGPPGQVSGQPTHTLCVPADVAAYNAIASANNTAGITSFKDAVQIQAVGFDYPAQEASYPFNTSEAPTITGASGQADITTSYPNVQTFTVPAPAAT